MLKRRWLAGALLLVLTAMSAQAATTPVEMLRDIFRSPVTEWKKILGESKPLLTEQFFTNVEKRVRWGIENNHIDDAMRFAMVGDFAAEIKGRAAPYRIDLAQVFYDAQNYPMTGQMVDNIIITSPDTLPAKKAKYLKAAMAEMRKDFFAAHQLYVELAEAGYEEGNMWFKAGLVSQWLQQEKRMQEEWEMAMRAGNPDARVELEKYKRRIDGDWNEVLPPIDNSEGTNVALKANPNPSSTPAKPDKDARLVDVAVAIENGTLETAKDSLQELYREFPDDQEVIRQLSALLYRMGDLEEAKAFLDAQIASSPQSVDLIRFRANTFERMYDRSRETKYLESALADYKKAASMAPNHAFLPMELERAQKKGELVSGR